MTGQQITHQAVVVLQRLAAGVGPAREALVPGVARLQHHVVRLLAQIPLSKAVKCLHNSNTAHLRLRY